MKFLTILSLAFAGAMAQQACELNPAGITNVPAGNIDGTCQTLQQCNGVGGISIAQQCGSQFCCVKADCSGGQSACIRNTAGIAGTFVNGRCPPGLRCFRANNARSVEDIAKAIKLLK
ncbi:hypothetical protein BDZ85DRAFT_297847 [Elsinoe ampelina]|uniref:Uncharacterized protein n=1 Tax=Elsinoe ampelina TaxID=302913 RepID=A0A6A6G6N9_9PEZI|nr:hypothetical protein BDZ85DRAFT_297847 [Elsinoe ampelina]